MWELYQFALCPFSRKVRLLLGEKGIGYTLKEELPWQQRDEFIDINPAGQVPVMVDAARGTRLIDSMAICEYFEETVDKTSLINGTAAQRAEIRRLVAWFDTHFYVRVTAPLLHERMFKRLVTNEQPDSGVLRQAMRASLELFGYVDHQLGKHNWIAGNTMSLADLAAAAQISVAQYLGGIDLRGHEETARWYAAFKSRPSFRPLLAERMAGIIPAKGYTEIDGDY